MLLRTYLVLCSGTSPGGAGVPYTVPGTEPGSAVCKVNLKPCIISLAPENSDSYKLRDYFLC